MTKDGLWWDISPDAPRFHKVMVSFEQKYLTEEIANDFYDNRAFYFLAERNDYAKTPTANPIHFSVSDYIASQVKSAGNDYTDTNLMIKLYSYIGKFVLPVTKTKETECRNMKKQCAAIKKYNNWKSQFPELGNGAEVKVYENGHQTLFQLYDENTKELMLEANINEYNKGFVYSDEFKINKNGKTSCYKLEPTERFLKQHPGSATDEFRATHKGCSDGHVYAIWTYLDTHPGGDNNCAVTEVSCN